MRQLIFTYYSFLFSSKSHILLLILDQRIYQKYIYCIYAIESFQYPPVPLQHSIKATSLMLLTSLPRQVWRSSPSSWQLRINSMLAVSAMYCMVRLGISFSMQASAQLGTVRVRYVITCINPFCVPCSPCTPRQLTTYQAFRKGTRPSPGRRNGAHASDNHEWDR